jgi:uncharacterized protein (DUF1800 family)
MREEAGELLGVQGVPSDMILVSEQDKVAHLLRRFGLGASEAELDFYGRDGLKGAIDKLLDYPSQPVVLDLSVEQLQGDQNILRPQQTSVYWMTRLLTTVRPLEEKLTLFWHDHFATSATKVSSGPIMYDHLATLRKHVFSRFEDMLLAVSHDVAMLFWLDNQLNVRGKPNENFAREIMELFTLGVGHYTEHDVQESARAFTGWTYAIQRGNRMVPIRGDQLPRRGAVFFDDRAQHDTGIKEFLGNKGPFRGEDVVGILCGNPQTARYIAKKMWEFFAYPKPEAGLVDRLASIYRSSGLDNKALVRAIMESPEFYSDASARKLVKHPVDFSVSIARQLGMGARLLEGANEADLSTPAARGRAFAPALITGQAITAMGMQLLYPPDVNGWPSGLDWISTSTMVERIRLADRYFGNPTVATPQRPAGAGQAPQNNPGRGTPSLRWPMWDIMERETSPEGVARRMVSLLDAPIPPQKITKLVDAARDQSGGSVNARNANAVAWSVGRLIFGSPEFQFA